MKISFDCDGVLACFEKNVIQVANKMWPDMNIPEDYVPRDWNYTDLFTKYQWSDVWEEIKKIPDFWLREPAMEENVAALREWIPTVDHQLFFITSRIPTGGVDPKAQTQLWLHKHGLFREDKPPIVIAVNSADQKKEYIAKYGIDMSIDDLASTVESCKLIPKHQAVLLNRPWNAKIECDKRVDTVKEFLCMSEYANYENFI